MTQPQDKGKPDDQPLPVEPGHVMTPAQFKRVTAEHYQALAREASGHQPEKQGIKP
jgi:hypothetical protein